MSLTSRLLSNTTPEIELSDHRRLPSSGSESPSSLLNGESPRAEPIADLDLFFERLYGYYCGNGLLCIIVKWVFELLKLAFTIFLSGVFLLFVDWNGLRSAKCGIDAVESGVRPCDLAKEAFRWQPLVPFTLLKGVIIVHLVLVSSYWAFNLLRFFAQLKETLYIRQFYHNCLNITDREVQTTSWAVILEKIVQVQQSHQLCVVKDLSAHDIIMRIMRKENYLIGMVNKGVLAFPITSRFPGAGPAISSRENGRKNCLILTKALECMLNWCILQSMFDGNFCVRRDFIDNPSSLRKRLITAGIVMFLISPFLVLFMLVYLFLRHAEQLYNHPSTASSRRWSNLSKWILREFNEVDHLLEKRINGSVEHAAGYLKEFPTPIVSLTAKFISFVSGGFAAILIIIALLEESLLEGHIFGRNLIWYAAVFGTVTAMSRMAAVTDELHVLDPIKAMSHVVEHTHYMPKKWRGRENTDSVRKVFEIFFQYTWFMLLEEMASIFLTPYLLIFVVPEHVANILRFIEEFTVHIKGVGDVCSLSAFDFERHGNSKYGSPCNATPHMRSSQGKLEKSFLSFHTEYPTWEPNAQGKRFLSILRNFKEQETMHLETQHIYSPTRAWQLNQPVLRRVQPIYLRPPPPTNPYLLDRFYSSSPHDVENPIDPIDLYEEEQGDLVWPPRKIILTNHEPTPPDDRLGSHLGTSTSSPVFSERESFLQNHNAGDMECPINSHWWRRSQQQQKQPQTSFLEPNFSYYSQPHMWTDNTTMDRSRWRSFLLDEIADEGNGGGGAGVRLSNHRALLSMADEDFNLTFDDIYSQPLTIFNLRLDSSNEEAQQEWQPPSEC
ncbi:hypothetical protein QJS10_CPA05g00944 [Acorus calamus]|uniref:Autophagy-related protein 9 n=1 Tax=Acorus calamus TaxID=4465 RepID=A0AAV9ETH3_ACOCL|nr:hypothetical protein QJS10_CPA05g00944 [Acorus calamus]